MRYLFIILSFLFLAATNAPSPPLFSGGTGSGNTYVVSPTGSGTTCSEALPCSLNEGLSQAQANETVLLKNGVYQQPLHTVRSGTAGNHIIIRAENNRQAIIRANPTSDKLVRVGHNFITIDGLYIDNLHDGHGIGNQFGGGHHHIIIENNTVFEAGLAGIRIHSTTAANNDIIIRNNIVQGSGYSDEVVVGSALYVGESGGNNGQGVTRSIIYSNDLSDYTSNCADLKQDTKDLWFYQNVCHDDANSTDHGVSPLLVRDGQIMVQGSGNYVYNNVVHSIIDNEIFDMRKSTDSVASLVYNNIGYGSPSVVRIVEARPGNSGAAGKFYNNTFFGLGGYAVDESDHALTVVNNIGPTRTNNLTVPASNYFVDSANGNFRLTALATGAIDQVSGEPFSSTDFDGVGIIDGTRDYGAFEGLAATNAPSPPLFSGGTGSVDLNYAHPAGSGTTCSTGSPCSLTTCISETFAGGSCILQNGTYITTGPVVTVRSGSPGSHIVIKAENNRQAIIRTNTTDRVFRINHNYITVDGLFLDGQHKGHGIGTSFSGGQHHLIIENNTVFESGRTGIRLNSTSAGNADIIIRGNLIDGSGYEAGQVTSEGIYIGEAGGSPVHDFRIIAYQNEIRDFDSNCFDVKASTKDVWLYENVCHSDVDSTVHGVSPSRPRDGIILLQGSGNYAYNNTIHSITDDGDIFDIRKSTDGVASLVYNNVVYGSPAVTRIIEARPDNSGAIGKVYNNTFFGMGGYSIIESDHTLTIVNNIGPTRTNNLTVPASNYFVNSAGGDFRLTALATGAIDQVDQVSGDPFSSTDFDGVGIIDGTRDYGAFEGLAENTLIAHWTFDSTLVDAEGNQNLTWGGGGSPVYVQGILGSAISFDGAHYATAGTHSILGTDLFPASDNPFSVAAYFKTSSTGTVISSAVSTESARDFQIFLQTGTLDTFLRGVRTVSPQAYNDGQWHHVAFTWNGTSARYYIDGVFISTMTVGTSVEDTAEHIIIGARTGGSGFPFTGSIDDVRIYNYAISQSEIDDLVVPPMAPMVGAYGPAREACHSTITDPGAIVLDANDSWHTIINAGGGGQVYLLDSSQGGFATSTTQVWRNVKVYAENCEDVVLDLAQSLRLGSNTVVAGLELNMADADRCVEIDDDVISAESLVTNVTLRNNNIYGGDAATCVSIQSNVTNSRIQGNIINGGATNGFTVAVRGDGRFTTCNGQEPENITIEDNDLLKDFTQIPGWTLAHFNNTEDQITTVAAGNVIIRRNRFRIHPSNGEEYADDKYSCNGASTIYERNYFQGVGYDSPTKACLLAQTETTATGTNNSIVLMGNMFDECDEEDPAKEGVVFGAKDPDVFLGGMWYNVVKQKGDGTDAVNFRDTSNTFDVRHNTVINGAITFRGGGNPSQATAFSEFEDNILTSGSWSGVGNASISSCSHNVNHSSTGSLPGGCGNTITTDPLYANDVLCTTSANCDFTPTNASFRSQVGSDGQVRGALVPPILNSASVESATPSRVDINLTPYSATGLGSGGWSWDTAPISNVSIPAINCNGTGSSVCVAGAARTISSATVSGSGQIRLTLASAITAGQAVEFDANYGWCQDSANIGGIGVNARCTAVSNFTVTNNTSGGPAGPDITNGLVALWSFENNFDDSIGTSDLIFGGSGSPVFIAGQIGQAIEFNGLNFATTGFHEVGGVNLFASATETWSVSVWWATVATGTIIASAVDVDTDRDFQIAQSNSGLDFYLRGSRTTDTRAYQNGSPHHAVVTWDGTTAKAYVDGLLFNGNLPVGTSAEDTGQSIVVGARTNGAGFRLNGAVDEVRLYNRAITETEVSVIFSLMSNAPQPGVPEDFEITVISESELLLNWSPSLDFENNPVAFYHIEACAGVLCSNFVEFDTSTDETYNATGLTQGLLYRFQLRAEDTAGTLSPYSEIAEGTPENVNPGEGGRNSARYRFGVTRLGILR